MLNVSIDDVKNIITRLETVCKNLENNKSSSSNISNISSAMLTTEKIAAFTDYWNKTLRLLIEFKTSATETKNSNIELLTEIAIEALCAHQDILIGSENHQKPVNNDAQNLSKKISNLAQKALDVGNSTPTLKNHSEAIKNGIEAIYWIFQDSGCDCVAQTFFESIDFPGNKILREKIPEMTKWVKAFKAVVKEIVDLVSKNYKTGLVWNSRGEKNFDSLFLSIGKTYRDNFKKHSDTSVETKADSREQLMFDIQSGVSLKPIQKDSKDEAKESKITVSSETSDHSQIDKFASKTRIGLRASIYKKGKTEKFEEGKSSFFLQNFENESKTFDDNLLQTKTAILISNSSKSTFEVPKKINKIGLTNCEEVKLIVDSVISIVEITNCKKIQIFVKKLVNSFSVDQTDGAVIHLSLDSKDAQFYTSKSSDILIRIQKDEDAEDYTELVIPEQFVFTINKSRKLEAKISDLYGY